jgi:arsenate reductase
MTPKLRILFLCTGNSCRSQMAEGWARHLKADVIEAYSAGTAPSTVDPRAVTVMAEAGVDISGQKSKHVDTFKGLAFDYVITLCGSDDNCPFFPSPAKAMHVPFDDPPQLARGARTEEEALAHYRRVRDEIKAFVQSLPAILKGDDK